MFEISKANGRGKCHHCGKIIEAGMPVLIAYCHGWVHPRYCAECIIRAAKELNEEVLLK